MILYHGSDSKIDKPDVLHSKLHLDFGIGFYTTTNKDQAERWAKRKALINNSKIAFVNVYEVKIDKQLEVKDFGDNYEAWIDFVCDCRQGQTQYKQYDVIIGKVADDRVFRVVDMYLRGLIDKDKAIKEIKIYKTYDQIAFISQKAIDSSIIFKDCYEVPV